MTELQNDRLTERTKTIIFDLGDTKTKMKLRKPKLQNNGSRPRSKSDRAIVRWMLFQECHR